MNNDYDGSLITSSEKGSQGLIFDPYAFESNLGLNTERGREILLLSDGNDEEEHQKFVSSEKLEQFDYALSEVVGRSYGVSKLPYGVLVNSEGKISSLGIVNSREHLESLFEAERMHVASIQEYLQQADEGSNADVVQQYDSTRR